MRWALRSNRVDHEYSDRQNVWPFSRIINEASCSTSTPMWFYALPGNQMGGRSPPMYASSSTYCSLCISFKLTDSNSSSLPVGLSFSSRSRNSGTLPIVGPATSSWELLLASSLSWCSSLSPPTVRRRPGFRWQLLPATPGTARFLSVGLSHRLHAAASKFSVCAGVRRWECRLLSFSVTPPLCSRRMKQIM